MLQEQYRALMQYSIPKESHADKLQAKNSQDWHCVKVYFRNYLLYNCF
jgi:RNA-binding protein 5/10